MSEPSKNPLLYAAPYPPGVMNGDSGYYKLQAMLMDPTDRLYDFMVGLSYHNVEYGIPQHLATVIPN